MSKQKKPLTLISSSTFSHSKSTLALPLQAYPLCCADTIDMQLSRLHKYQNQWWWHMLFPFWCKTALGDCLAPYLSSALPGCLSVFFFFPDEVAGYWLKLLKGNMFAFTDKLGWRIDPRFNLAGRQKQQISMHAAQKKKEKEKKS